MRSVALPALPSLEGRAELLKDVDNQGVGIVRERGALRLDTLGPRNGSRWLAAKRTERPALGNGAYLTAHSAGRLCAVKLPSDRDNRKGGGRRGKVSYFSSASRLRMMKMIHTVRRSSALPVFVTLTFPDLFPSFDDAKRLIDTLFKRWRRRWPEVSALWRIEAKPRLSGSEKGNVAPHFHLLVWGRGFDGEKAREDWFDVCGSSEYAHWRHGYDGATELKNWEQAAAYCAQYCAKKGNVDAPGRQWGVHNRAALPVDRDAVRVTLTLREAFACRRAVRSAIRAKIGRTVRCAASLYTSDPESLLRYVALMRGVSLRGRTSQMSRQQEWRAMLPAWEPPQNKR